MIKTSEIFIPVPKSRNTKCKVEIGSDDVTSKIVESEWVYPCTIGLGTFKAKLSNAMGQVTGKYTAGATIKFYADNSNGTTLQFWGRVDYPKDILNREGQFLEIEGRHRSYILTETLVCHRATATDPAQILKDIITNHTSGFTSTNVNNTGLTMDVEWNYKPFWDCVLELCNYANFDCYVDNSLDFHFFAANSIENSKDAIAEKDNFLQTEDWGTDDYYERTRVIGVGQDDEGMPIVYTAISSGEGEVQREVFVKDSSANTEEKVKVLAESKLTEMSARPPQAIMKSLGLETTKPGENIWIAVPRQKIYGLYKIIQLTHRFGSKIGGWRTDSLVEKAIIGTQEILQERARKEIQITQAENVNKLNFSYNFTFDDDTLTQSHSGTQVSNGKLVTTSQSSTEGTWISKVKTVPDNVTEIEMRAKGKDIRDSEFYFSLNSGSTWEQLSFSQLGTKVIPAGIGRNIMVKVILKRSSSWTNLNPEVDSLVFLYS